MNSDIIGNTVALAFDIDMQSICSQVIDTFEVRSHPNRPSHRCSVDLQNLFDLIHQFDGITNITV